MMRIQLLARRGERRGAATSNDKKSSRTWIGWGDFASAIHERAWLKVQERDRDLHRAST